MLPDTDQNYRSPRLDLSLPESTGQTGGKRFRYLTLTAVLIIAALLMACGYFQGQASKYHEWYITESYRSDSIAAVNQQLQQQIEQLNNQVITRKTSSRLTYAF